MKKVMPVHIFAARQYSWASRRQSLAEGVSEAAVFISVPDWVSFAFFQQRFDATAK